MKNLDAYMDAASALIDLPIDDAHKEGVKRFLAIAHEMAATLEAVPLDEDELALAPVYTPPSDDAAGGAA